MMDPQLHKVLAKAANTIRGLSFEAVQKANSGHPGLPMGCAEIGAYLYGVLMKHDQQILLGLIETDLSSLPVMVLCSFILFYI